MRALVAGATGYAGSAVVRELRSRGIDTVAHVRTESAAIERAHAGFSPLGAEVRECEWTAVAIEQLLSDVRPTMVFALLGTTRKRAKLDGISGDIYEKVEGKLTRMLLDATCHAVPSARFVLLSSLGTREGARGSYLKARAAMERAVLASGLSYTIARPSFVSGVDRSEFRPIERMGARVVDGALALGAVFGARGLRARLRSITASDLARALVTAALDAGCENRVLESTELQALVRSS